MSTNMKIVAWFWISMSFIMLLDLVIFCNDALAWFYHVNKNMNAFSDIVRFVPFMVGGVGLLHRKAYGWWILVIVSGLGIINITTSFLISAKYDPEIGEFIMVFLANIILVVNLVILLMNPPNKWQYNEKDDK